ncbi:phage holin family protein [Corynebacterium sp. TA-R-1]|uniref:Phage holin family protein n=1 Tax=Corynebacterium stercoris TaxID=2943490 RepID=A0ABT1G3B9_9CORY|nr:phage holin family protein [Corynebacterium stercoris]
MSKEGLYTSGSTAVSAKVDSIPLRDTGVTQPGQDSIGTLISNATEQVSTLVRGEIELAKAEVIGEVKKGAMGGGMFAAAGVIALYSTFFLFFALAEMFASWMHRGWAFLLVFLIMLALAGLLAFLGFKKVRKIKAPEKTIESVNELKNLVPGQAQANLAKDESGLYSTTPVAAPRSEARTTTTTTTRTTTARPVRTGGSTAVTRD